MYIFRRINPSADTEIITLLINSCFNDFLLESYLDEKPIHNTVTSAWGRSWKIGNS